MMGDNDSTDLKVTNSQKQEQRAHNKCVEGRRRDREDARERKQTQREIISDGAYEIPGSNLVIHT